MVSESDIDWKRQAEEFLRLHGWTQDKDNPFDPDAWGHPCFPLLEDFSGQDAIVKFCEDFYGSAWDTYKSFVGLSVLSDSDGKEVN
jgi:hypothetical protein